MFKKAVRPLIEAHKRARPGSKTRKHARELILPMIDNYKEAEYALGLIYGNDSKPSCNCLLYKLLVEKMCKLADNIPAIIKANELAIEIDNEDGKNTWRYLQGEALPKAVRRYWGSSKFYEEQIFQVLRTRLPADCCLVQHHLVRTH